MTKPANADHPNVIALPPLIFAGCEILGGLFQFMFPIPIMRHSLALPAGIALALASGAMGIWAVLVMNAAGTNVRPDRPSLSIVRNGPYRITRNPMYLGMCLVQVATGLIVNGWMPVLFAVPLALILHFGVILREERYLEGKFNGPYSQFKQRTRRWI